MKLFIFFDIQNWFWGVCTHAKIEILLQPDILQIDRLCLLLVNAFLMNLDRRDRTSFCAHWLVLTNFCLLTKIIRIQKSCYLLQFSSISIISCLNWNRNCQTRHILIKMYHCEVLILKVSLYPLYLHDNQLVRFIKQKSLTIFFWSRKFWGFYQSKMKILTLLPFL